MRNLSLPLALAALTVIACNERPTGPDAGSLGLTPAFAKGGTPGGGGKPEKPAADIPLRVVFEESGTDGITNGIRSDGLGNYVHKQDFVSAVIRDNGMLYFQSFDGKRRDPVLRGVKVNLASLETEPPPSSDLYDFMLAVGENWPEFTSDVTLHTRDADGGMYTMPENSTLVDGGKIGFNDYGDGSTWEWRLLFDSRVDGKADGIGLCLTHPTPDTWHVMTDGTECGADGDEVDDVAELWRLKDGVFTHVANFKTPMHLSLSRN